MGGYQKWTDTTDVYIHGVRLNDPAMHENGKDLLNQDPDSWPATQVGLWVPQGPRSGSKVERMYIDSLWSSTTLADGINFHGNIETVRAYDLAFYNTGDDGVAFWATESEIRDVEMSNLVLENVGKRFFVPNEWGHCLAVFGVNGLTVDGVTCVQPSDHSERYNSALMLIEGIESAFVDSSAYQGDSNYINISNWRFIDENGKNVTSDEFPLVRKDDGHFDKDNTLRVCTSFEYENCTTYDK